MRRNPVAVASIVLVVLALGGGVAGILWQAREARREAAKARAVRDVLVGIIHRSSIERAEGVAAGSVTAEQLLDIGADRIRKELRDSPEVRGRAARRDCWAAGCQGRRPRASRRTPGSS